MSKIFCTNCGAETNPDDRFCSSCGNPQRGSKPVYQSYSTHPHAIYALEETKQHIKLLGMVELSFGILTIFIVSIAYLALSTFITPGFLHTVGAEIPSDVPFRIELLFSFIKGLLVLIGLSAVIDIIGGILLLQQKKSGKIFTYISAVFSFLNFPIGTIYAVGAFWVLSKPETDQILK